MPTDGMKREFGRMKAGYPPEITKPKETNGSLWVDGYLQLYNLPFPILQVEKKKLIAGGINKCRIRIGYNKNCNKEVVYRK